MLHIIALCRTNILVNIIAHPLGDSSSSILVVVRVIVVVVVVVVVKLHITTQPGPVVLIFLCYMYGFTLWWISGCSSSSSSSSIVEVEVVG